MKWASFIVRTAIVVAVLAGVAVEFGHFEMRRLSAKVDELEAERQRLAEFAKRLQSSRRVGQIDVVKQAQDAQGRTVMVLLWQEISEGGSLGRPVALEVVGTQVYVEGRVLKFDTELLKEGSGDRGVSLAMFRRIFGDKQIPDSAIELDRAAGPPLAAIGPGGEPAGAQRLWERFWELTEDSQLARQLGVRVAQCEAPSVRMRVGQVWEVSLDTAGGLNLRKLGERMAAEASASP